MRSMSVRKQIWGQTRNRISAQLWDQFRGVRTKVLGEVWLRVDETYSQVWEQVKDQSRDERC